MKSINRKDRNGFARRSQRNENQGFDFASFAIALCALRLKSIFDNRYCLIFCEILPVCLFLRISFTVPSGIVSSFTSK